MCISKLRFPTLVFTSLALSACSIFSLDTETDEERDYNRSLISGGRTRNYLVHLPPNHEDGNLPLLIMLHGGGGSPPGIQILTGFDAVADELGFVVIYPQAYSDWADGCDCSDAEANGIDDVVFVSDLIEAIDDEFDINPNRVSVAGFSLGGMMAYKLACDFGDNLVSVAAVGGTMTGPQWANCDPAGPVRMTIIGGTEDPGFPWEGPAVPGYVATFSMDSTVHFWATNNSCDAGPTPAHEYTGPTSGIEVWRETYENCATGGDLELYRLEGGGHVWPQGGWSASWTIGRFMMEN